MILIRIIIVLFMISLNFYDCTSVCGTGSEVEAKYAVKGTVVYNNGKPVSDAIVRIRPSDYLAMNHCSHSFTSDTSTDSKGVFCFNSIESDSFTIEINKGRKFGKIISLSISQEDTFPIIIPVDTVRPTGSIKGRINLPISDDTLRPVIAIYGVEYIEKSLITQDFTFEGIPEGIYNLRIIPYTGSNLILELHNVEVYQDSTTDVGTLLLLMQQFFKGCNSFECDSIAVRSILDSNGLYDLPVKSVVSVDPVSLRITALNLPGKSLSTLTKNIGSLSSLEYLNVTRNRISKIPSEIGYLTSLKEIIADSNQILSVPLELCYCDSLRKLSLNSNVISEIGSNITRLKISFFDARNNNIHSLPSNIGMMSELKVMYIDNNIISGLPPSLLSLRMNAFSINNNWLCNVTDDFKKWLNLFDSTWEFSQNCQNYSN